MYSTTRGLRYAVAMGMVFIMALASSSIRSFSAAQRGGWDDHLDAPFRRHRGRSSAGPGQGKPLLGLDHLHLGALYFPGAARGDLLLVAPGERGTLGFEAYRRLFADANFWPRSPSRWSTPIAAILLSLLIIVPTAYWVTLKLPKLRPVVEFITLPPS